MRVRSASAVVIGLLAALLYAVAPSESAVAQTTTANEGVVASMAVDPVAVRAAGHIPSRWKLKLDSHGKALLVVFMYDGTAIINGTSRPYRWVSTSVYLDSTNLPAGIHSTSDVEGVRADVYLLDWTTSSWALASRLRAAGAGPAAEYVPALNFSMGAGATPSFHFSAGRPALSPFTFSAHLTPTFIPTSSDTVNFWRDAPTGTLKISTNDNRELLGQFLNWSLTTSPTTPLAHMMGAAKRTRSCSPAAAIDPILGLAAHEGRLGCISRETFANTSVSWTFFPPK